MEGSADDLSTHASYGRNDAHDEPVISSSTTSTTDAAPVAQTLSAAHIDDDDAIVATTSIPPEVKRFIISLPDASTTQNHRASSMPGAHAGLKPWPNIHSPTREQPLSSNPPAKTTSASTAATTAAAPSNGTNSTIISTSTAAPPANTTTSSPHFSRPSPKKQASSTAAPSSEQPYYDSATQPLSVSQQTSASAVRDMALRKGTTSVLKNNSKADPHYEQRPLKSALKPFTSKKVEEITSPPLASPPQAYPVMSPPPLTHNNSSSSTRLRFPRWTSLLSRNNSGTSDRAAVFSPLSRTASAHSGHSDRHTTPNTLRPKRSIGWDQPLQSYDEARNSSVQSDVSDRVRQAKLAEGDVYEKAKMNVRRPPKGIQNWFDGFEISSDEDDVTPLAKPQGQQQHNEGHKQSFDREAASSQQRSHDARQGNMPSKAERLLGHSMPPNRPDHDSLHDRLVPADTDRYQSVDDDYFQFAEGNITPKPQQHAYRNAGYSSSHHTSSNSRGSSYDTGTDRSDQYYRGSDHYSSNSDAVQHARMIDVNRPAIPPRRMQAPTDNWHRMNSYQSSSSRPALTSHNSSSKFSNQSRRTYDEHEDDDEGRTSTFKSYGTTSTSSTAAKARSRGNTRMSSSHAESAGGVPLDGLSAEIQHMMAVTEEEMALLEMMRNKRAAMNKPNYTKSYRKALEREHEQLMQRRLYAQQTALKILRDQQELQSRRDETEETNDTMDGEVDEHEIMRLDKLRHEELNRIQRLEKFLATNASLVSALQDTGMHRVDQRHGRPSGGDSRPRLNRADSSEQDRDRGTSSRHQRRMDGYGSPLDLPSPPAYDEERLIYGERPKKNRSNIKAARHLATLEEERLSAAFERAQRKSRTILANHSAENVLAQQNRASQQDHERVRKQAQTPTFLRSISDYQSADHRSITSGNTSVNASVVSPLTPNSLEPREPEKRSSFGPFDSEDDMRFPPDTSSPELNFSKPSRGMLPPSATRKHYSSKKKHQQQLPSALTMIADEDRRHTRDSLESSGSAGGDVLAAWAELGGAEGILPGRRPIAH